MKKFSTLKEAKSEIERLTEDWSDNITITNVVYTRGVHGVFVDMTAERVSYYFLNELERVTGDTNPIVIPNDEETVNIGLYLIINDSDE